MPGRLTLEQKIGLHAVLIDGRLVVNGLVSTRSGGIAAALAGRPATEIPSLLPRLFPLCGMAHAGAAAAAIEAALDVRVTPAQRAFRELLLLSEHATALGWRILMDWVPFVAGTPDLSACAEIRRAGAAVAAIGERGEEGRIGGARLRPRREPLGGPIAGLADRLVALFPEAADPALSFPALQTAIRDGTSIPGRLIEMVRARLPADYGRHGRPFLATADSDWFAARLAMEPGFSDTPTLDGTPAEVGPLAARRHPLIADALAQWGPGLATRLLAAALDVPVVASRLRAAGARLAEDDPVAIDPLRTGIGTGVVETARGPLAYYVEVERGRVRKLRSVAPTEWNFHPRGPFLAALEAAPKLADPVAAARLLAASFDPCVPFEVELAPVVGAAPMESVLHA